MFLAKPELMETIRGVLTYQQGDTIKCLVIDDQSQCTYEVSFLNESAPCSEVTTYRSLSEYEMNLIKVREKYGVHLRMKKNIRYIAIKTIH